MEQNMGASTSSTGLSPTVERASGLDGSATSIPCAFDQGYLAALSDVTALVLTWRDENRKAAGQAGRCGDKSMRDRLDGSATECHALAGELLKRAQAIEARRAETGTGSVEDESAVGNADAPHA